MSETAWERRFVCQSVSSGKYLHVPFLFVEPLDRLASARSAEWFYPWEERWTVIIKTRQWRKRETAKEQTRRKSEFSLGIHWKSAVQSFQLDLHGDCFSSCREKNCYEITESRCLMDLQKVEAAPPRLGKAWHSSQERARAPSLKTKKRPRCLRCSPAPPPAFEFWFVSAFELFYSYLPLVLFDFVLFRLQSHLDTSAKCKEKTTEDLSRL